MNHLATAFAGRYNDFLFFPTRHNDPLCYVNKTSWLSTDLSAAAAAALRSAPKTMHQRRDSCSKPKQSLTSGKVTHHISFTLSISGDAATFWRLFFSAQRQQALWNLFSAWCQFLKESCSRSATFVITVEKPTLWLCPDKKKKRNKKCFRSRLQELFMGKNHCYSGYTVMPHLMCGLLQGKFTWAILKQETVRTWVRPF